MDRIAPVVAAAVAVIAGFVATLLKLHFRFEADLAAGIGIGFFAALAVLVAVGLRRV